MAKEPFEQFAVPNELRAFAEQSVTQARKAFEGFIQGANQAVGHIHGQRRRRGQAPARSRISRWNMPRRTWRRRSSSPKS